MNAIVDAAAVSPAAAPTEGMPITVAVADCRPSPTNPRRTFAGKRVPKDEQAKLQGLADDIALRGLIQRIVVRDNPKGDSRYEIVAGERRWRAATLAGLTTIPASLVALPDAEVLEWQIVENGQRADVHPLEEAESYEHLSRVMGRADAAAIAVRVSKDRAYVAQRLKLLALSADARRAFRDGKLTFDTALMLARVPTGPLQDEALARITQGVECADSALNAAHVRDILRRSFMTVLAQAPFSTKDATLLPAAGACTVCPKRTGNAPDLFADVKEAGTCTDTACYGAKRSAHYARLREEACARGQRVITGDEAKKIFEHSWSHDPKGFVPLDSMFYVGGERKTHREVMGKGVETVLIEKPSTGELVECVTVEVARRARQSAGVARPQDTTDYKEKAREAERARKREQDARNRIRIAVREAREAEPLSLAEQRAVAALLWRKLGSDAQRPVGKERGWDLGYHSHDAADAIAQMDGAQVAAFLRDLTIAPHQYVPGYTSDLASPSLDAIATGAGVDPAAIRAQVAAEAEAKKAGKGKGKAAKPATADHAKRAANDDSDRDDEPAEDNEGADDGEDFDADEHNACDDEPSAEAGEADGGDAHDEPLDEVIAASDEAEGFPDDDADDDGDADGDAHATAANDEPVALQPAVYTREPLAAAGEGGGFDAAPEWGDDDAGYLADPDSED